MIYPDAYVRNQQGEIRRAAHITFDRPGRQTCPHCAIGQVELRIGTLCRYCKGVVVDIQSREWS
jgi:hypothetical protein